MNAIFRQLLVAGTGAGLMVAACAPGLAQNQNSTADHSAQPQHSIQMVPALASLDHTLDAKKAKQGEPVTAKLQKDVKIPEQVLPKNTVLEGHVDQVQPSEHKGDSTVVVTFDKAKLKSGQELPIKATVMAIAQPAYMQQQPTAEAAGGEMPSGGGGGMPSGAAPSGGASPSGTAPSAAAPQPMAMPNQASGSQRPTQRNGVPGVKLQSDIHQQASATFSSKGKNVRLPDGMQMDVALAVIPAGVRIQ
ncbi:MAG TPA: hypothetical protein VHU89_16225 [Acidobacteriaceae bacterium]|jgi:hypothetical protein|nr:hypothetical protein [Acidobacteriaceae bacterium]